MIPFDPAAPFPLVKIAATYDDEKAHAAQVDAWLGFETDPIESELRYKSAFGSDAIAPSRTPRTVDEREFWIGKSVQTFSTPYTELRAILEDLRENEKRAIVDLGSGYGRMAHVMGRHCPTGRFFGFEIVRERHEEARRVFDRSRERGIVAASFVAEFKCDDVSRLDFSALPPATFFLYDFGSRHDVETCMSHLQGRAKREALTVVARGGRSRDIIGNQHPWLSQVVTPVHRGHYSIYRTHED